MAITFILIPFFLLSSYGRENVIKAENVIFGFDSVTASELEYFEDCPKILELNGKVVEIYCDDMKVLEGC